MADENSETTYEVKCKHNDYTIMISTKEKSCKVTGLTADTFYQVTVTAKNTCGQGTESDSVRVKTKCSTPSIGIYYCYITDVY